MAIELRNRLQKAMNRTLPSPVVFNYPNARALGSYLAGLMAANDPHAPMTVDDGQPAAATLDASQIDSLSDEEAEALLAARMAALEQEEV